MQQPCLEVVLRQFFLPVSPWLCLSDHLCRGLASASAFLPHYFFLGLGSVALQFWPSQCKVSDRTSVATVLDFSHFLHVPCLVWDVIWSTQAWNWTL